MTPIIDVAFQKHQLELNQLGLTQPGRVQELQQPSQRPSSSGQGWSRCPGCAGPTSASAASAQPCSSSSATTSWQAATPSSLLRMHRKRATHRPSRSGLYPDVANALVIHESASVEEYCHFASLRKVYNQHLQPAFHLTAIPWSFGHRHSKAC